MIPTLSSLTVAGPSPDLDPLGDLVDNLEDDLEGNLEVDPEGDLEVDLWAVGCPGGCPGSSLVVGSIATYNHGYADHQ